jgi:hypothetical protein
MVEQAREAIIDVFSDTTVSQSVTLASLSDLADEINMHSNSIRMDMAKAAGDLYYRLNVLPSRGHEPSSRSRNARQPSPTRSSREKG